MFSQILVALFLKISAIMGPLDHSTYAEKKRERRGSSREGKHIVSERERVARCHFGAVYMSSVGVQDIKVKWGETVENASSR